MNSLKKIYLWLFELTLLFTLGLLSGPSCEEKSGELFPENSEYKWIKIDESRAICVAFAPDGTILNRKDLKDDYIGVEEFHCRDNEGSRFSWVETDKDQVTCMEITKDGLIVNKNADKNRCREVTGTYFIWWPAPLNEKKAVCYELTVDQYIVDENSSFENCRLSEGSQYRWITVEGKWSRCWEFAKFAKMENRELVVTEYAEDGFCKSMDPTSYEFRIEPDGESVKCVEVKGANIVDTYVDPSYCRPLYTNNIGYGWYGNDYIKNCAELLISIQPDGSEKYYFIDRNAPQEKCVSN